MTSCFLILTEPYYGEQFKMYELGGGGGGGGHVQCVGEKENAYIILVRKLEEIFDIFVNCNCVATRCQLYNTHLHTNNTQNDTK
jgi:hypothetical protein